ncbi:MAG TPA: ATP-binding cassette domain-containing protein [Alphaproteobacteria bacterium]|nr:ATP-binding cassette domain-containing protein [Alphaproteobacteria bacterium]
MLDSVTFAWLKPFIRPLKPIFREVAAMSAFINLLALAVPVFTMQVYNRVIGSGAMSTLQGLVIGMVIIVAFDYILRQSRSRILQTIALRIDVGVGKQLFNKVVSMPLDVLEKLPGAHWQSLFRDVDMVRNTLSGSTAVLIADLPFAFLFLGIIFLIAPAIAWVLLVALPIFMFVAWRAGNVMASANSDERETTQGRDEMIAEMIAGRTTIKALALEGAMRPIWEKKHAVNIEKAISRGGKTDSFSNLGASLSMTTSVALTTIGALAIIDHQLTVGALVATNMMSSRIMGPLNQLVSQWRAYNGFVQAVGRLGALFNTPSERQESAVKMDRPDGQIVLEGVSFSYDPNLPPAVDNVHIAIKAGGIHAFVGRNGSGKSTILKLIQGLYKPNEGRVLIDNADVSQFTRAELAGWIGYVPQESILFAGSVHDNITYRKPDATDEEVLRAAHASGVHAFIIDMPDGYATDIGEAGRRLSGGQRQRITIARALVGDPPIVLLDEPSSGLDRQAEQELRRTLLEIAKTRTVVIITHSPILLTACDDLVALDKGKVALSGPAKEILPRLFGKAPKGPAKNPQGTTGNRQENSQIAAATSSAPPGPPKPKPKPKDTAS